MLKLAKWVKLVLKLAGIDVKRIQLIAAEKHQHQIKVLNVKEIMKSADWSNFGIFARFYEKPVEISINNFGTALLKQVC